MHVSLNPPALSNSSLQSYQLHNEVLLLQKNGLDIFYFHQDNLLEKIYGEMIYKDIEGNCIVTKKKAFHLGVQSSGYGDRDESI